MIKLIQYLMFGHVHEHNWEWSDFNKTKYEYEYTYKCSCCPKIQKVTTFQGKVKKVDLI